MNEVPSRREIFERADVTQAQYITLQGAARLTGMGAGLLLRLGATDPTFPRLICITARKRLYRVAELVAWIESRRGLEPLANARHRRGAKR